MDDDDLVDVALGSYDDTPGVPNSDTNGHGYLSAEEHFNRHYGNALYLMPPELVEPPAADTRGG